MTLHSHLLRILSGTALGESVNHEGHEEHEGGTEDVMSERLTDGTCSGQVIDAAMKVHSRLGPGLLESAYEACLAHELRARGRRVLTQFPLLVEYDGARIEVGYRLDMLVDDEVVVELKTVAKLLPIHEAQLLSYLRLGGLRVGLLINFHVPRLKDGVRRVLNGY